MTIKKGTAAPLEGEANQKVISALNSTYKGMDAQMCHQLAMTVEPAAPVIKNTGPKVAAPQVPSFMQMPTPKYNTNTEK